MSTALKVYHKLPPAARSTVASLRGYYLNWWRYDSRTDQLVEEALERDRWSADEWRAFQDERLGFLLERAAAKVPFYRRMWEERRRKGDKASWSYLENWPVLEKESLRSEPEAFVADDRSTSRMFHDHTSGTTGTSLDLWLSGETVKEWYALFEARARRWYGLSRNDRWAIFGGQLVAPVTRQKPPYWVWNKGLNQLYMSSYHLSAESAPAYVEALRKYGITYVLGYPSAIESLARESIRQGIAAPELKVAIANAEPLFEHQREAISEAFGCPVRETYGMAEIAAAASECEEGSLHQWPEAGIIETLDGGSADSGEFICTGLLNTDMPLIRYRVGDSGTFSEKECACGRGLTVIDAIEGRTDDLLYTKGGRRVGRMDPVFKGGIRMKEAQIVQESLTDIKVRFVPAEGLRAEDKDQLASRIRERLGSVEVEFEEVRQIPRTSRGKFRAVVCNISEEDRAAIRVLNDGPGDGTGTG
ncbi:MAG: phenylacetate--CoA ligase family protein [Acidobacteriota bacterium]|nr:MAG: phenylacetate--CoA ligase family protein [Acidobacteriota bacterium]